jgi:SAM-dependent methyltransferase
MAEYVYDQSFQDERARLAGIEALWNEGTISLLDRLGVGEGWRCLEVGAGGGAMVEELSRRVGPDGSVLATDVFTKFLDVIDAPNVEVREHDILNDELPSGEFDLVYARLVVEHLGVGALEGMRPAVKPGGLLLLEDYDFAAASGYPPDERFDRVRDGLGGFMESAGFDPHFGRRLPSELIAVGLEDVQAEGRVRLFRGGEPNTAFYRLTLNSLRPVLEEQGIVDSADVEASLAGLDDPARTFVSPTLVAGWGRAPL